MPEESFVAAIGTTTTTNQRPSSPPVDSESRYRLKRYERGTSRLGSVYAELRSLCLDGYTHVANMPGNFREILYYARRFRLVVLDHRVNKLIADLAADYFTQ